MIVDNPRQRALRALAEKHVTADHNTGAEDVAAYLPGGFGPYKRDPKEAELPKRFVAHTCSAELHYLYADYDDLADAKQRATAFVGDTIYAESPVAVHDLDTGDEYRPKLDTPWIKTTPEGRTTDG